MPEIVITVETAISTSVRAAQVSSMFDVPAQATARMHWKGSLPIEERPWQVGLIVGPSGAGKSTILQNVFGKPAEFAWRGKSVIDDFEKRHGVEAVAQICQAVGFNTIPAWLRPYGVLSNGEKFRVDLARRLIEGGALVACDEFTSVVDRQVAKIGANAVQKYIRRQPGRQFVAATCHYDLEEWLQPDWVLEPATMAFRWRAVQRRPEIKCTIHRATYDTWQVFARFHYMTASLARAAYCWVLCVEGQPAAFAAAMHRPHQKVQDIWGLSRGVVLPDFQGLGLIFALIDRIGAGYRTFGQRCHSYPAHPAYIRSHDRSPNWAMRKPPGLINANVNGSGNRKNAFGGRPCAVFEYVGPPMPMAQAELLIPLKNWSPPKTTAST